MSHARLAVLLRRFGVKQGSDASSELRSAYFRKARESHPDTGGQDDGADFIRIKSDHDEAQALLRRFSHAGPKDYSQTMHWEKQTWHRERWEDIVSSRNAAEPQAATRPGSPPLLVWIFGGSLVLGVVGHSLLSILSSEQTVPGGVVKYTTAQSVAKPIVKDRGPQPLERPATGYYSKRVKKSEPSEMLQKRPMAKQRGATYISPVHAAAEDGKAEWLHWVGERSRVSLCEALDKHQQTPLHYAARAGNFNTCAVLLKFQADPHAGDSRGRTPLDLARESNNADVIEMLRSGPPGPLANNQFRKKPSLKSQSRGIVG